MNKTNNKKWSRLTATGASDCTAATAVQQSAVVMGAIRPIRWSFDEIKVPPMPLGRQSGTSEAENIKIEKKKERKWWKIMGKKPETAVAIVSSDSNRLLIGLVEHQVCADSFLIIINHYSNRFHLFEVVLSHCNEMTSVEQPRVPVYLVSCYFW